MADTTTSTTPGGTDAGAPQQPAPAPAPPAQPAGQPTAPAGPAPVTGTPAATPGQVTPAAGKTFTQDDVDRILNDRMGRFEKSMGEKLASQLITALGGKPAEGNGAAKPEDVLAQAQQIVSDARREASLATVDALITGAQIKPERVATLASMVNVDAVLKDVDRANPAAVKAALKAAVDAKVAEFPEWKASTVPASSTANPNGAPGIPDIDARIAAATKAGDHALAISLKRAKARQNAG